MFEVEDSAADTMTCERTWSSEEAMLTYVNQLTARMMLMSTTTGDRWFSEFTSAKPSSLATF